jgi:hypothetical protein
MQPIIANIQGVSASGGRAQFVVKQKQVCLVFKHNVGDFKPIAQQGRPILQQYPPGAPIIHGIKPVLNLRQNSS